MNGNTYGPAAAAEPAAAAGGGSILMTSSTSATTAWFSDVVLPVAVVGIVVVNTIVTTSSSTADHHRHDNEEESVTEAAVHLRDVQTSTMETSVLVSRKEATVTFFVVGDTIAKPRRRGNTTEEDITETTTKETM